MVKHVLRKALSLKRIWILMQGFVLLVAVGTSFWISRRVVREPADEGSFNLSQAPKKLSKAVQKDEHAKIPSSDVIVVSEMLPTGKESEVQTYVVQHAQIRFEPSSKTQERQPSSVRWNLVKVNKASASSHEIEKIDLVKNDLGEVVGTYFVELLPGRNEFEFEFSQQTKAKKPLRRRSQKIVVIFDSKRSS